MQSFDDKDIEQKKERIIVKKNNPSPLNDEKAGYHIDLNAFRTYADDAAHWKKNYDNQMKSIHLLTMDIEKFYEAEQKDSKNTKLLGYAINDKTLTQQDIRQAVEELQKEFEAFIHQDSLNDPGGALGSLEKTMQELETLLLNPQDKNIDKIYQEKIDICYKKITAQLESAKLFHKTIDHFANKMNQWEKDFGHTKAGDHLLKNAYALLEKIEKSPFNEQMMGLSLAAKKLEEAQHFRLSERCSQLKQNAMHWEENIAQCEKEIQHLEKKIEQRIEHFNQIGEQLKAIGKGLLPEQEERLNALKNLSEDMVEMKDQLNVLKNGLKIFQNELTAYQDKMIRPSENFDVHKAYIEASGVMADSYDQILNLVDKISQHFTHFEQINKKTEKIYGETEIIKKDLDLQEELRTGIHEIFQHFSQSFRMLTIESNTDYQKEQQRIGRINDLLQKNYDHLALIENKLTETGSDCRGITELKENFSSLLLKNTVHENDLKMVINQYQLWLDELAKNPNLSPKLKHDFYDAIKNCQNNFKQLYTELSAWRISTKRYLTGIGLTKILNPLLSGALSIFLPGSSGVTAMTIHHGAPFVVGKAGEYAVTPNRTDIEESQKNQETNLPGKSQVIIDTSDRLKLETDQEWRRVWYAGILKELQHERTLLSALVTSISIPLVATGVGTPLALGLLTGGLAASIMAININEELIQRGNEEEVRSQIKAELENINGLLDTLNFGPVEKMFSMYYLETIQFLKKSYSDLLIQLNDMKDQSQISVLQDECKKTLAYIEKIENHLKNPQSALIETKEFPRKTDDSLKYKQQSDFSDLMHFLSQESEAKEGSLLSSSLFLEEKTGTSSVENMITRVECARNKVQELESLLTQLHHYKLINKSPLAAQLEQSKKDQVSQHTSGLFRQAPKTNDPTIAKKNHQINLLLPSHGRGHAPRRDNIA